MVAYPIFSQDAGQRIAINAVDSATLAGSDAGRAPRLTARAEGLGPKTPPSARRFVSVACAL